MLKLPLKKEKLTAATSVELDQNAVIKDLEQKEVYKYFGVDDSNRIHHKAMKEKIGKECYQRIRAFLKAEINSVYCIKAINTLVILVVMYSFSIINWTIHEI